MNTRTEKDSLGSLEVPAQAITGIFYERASHHFNPLSTLKAYPSFKKAFALIKLAAAKVNAEFGDLAPELSEAIQKAARAYIQGENQEKMDLGIYQAGAGTPFNMSLNEILANMANESLGQPRGSYSPVHPNDHVNMGQSSNDTTPSAIRIACALDFPALESSFEALIHALENKEKEFAQSYKIGRTHLQDAVPMTLGQEFGAYASALRKALRKIRLAMDELRALGLGGTAIGSGLNTKKGFAQKMSSAISEESGIPFHCQENTFESTHSMADMMALSNAFAQWSTELLRITNDLRLMASGPVSGFNEIILPAVEPGSSIMPGKINPSILECLSMICVQVIGLDHSNALCAQQGQLELNWHTPLLSWNLLHQMEILTHGATLLREACIEGILANSEEMMSILQSSTALATILAPIVGYAQVAVWVKESVAQKRPFIAIVPQEYHSLLDPKDMIEPKEI